MLSESFDHLSGDLLVAMFQSAKEWAESEKVDIMNMGMCRGARMLRDTHVGLPSPIPGDFIFEGDVDGVRREFLVRDYRVIWDRPL